MPAIPHIELVQLGRGTAHPLEEAVLAEVERRGQVTAVIVCLDSDEAALQAAMYVRDVMHKSNRWRAPIYSQISGDTGLGDVLTGDDTAHRFDDVIQIFGSDADSCDFEIIDGGLENTARRIHEAYWATRRERRDNDAEGTRQEPLADWDQLRETYRASNRRAADHIRAKLESAGCYVPGGLTFIAPRGFRLSGKSDVIEALARLEHLSWCIGMRLDGWRSAAKRNNRRREHDNLVTYDELTENEKEYDRDQIKLIDTRLIERSDIKAGETALRHDHWIGLIGRNRVDASDAQWAADELSDHILPSLAERHADAHFTIVTPLAPGLDYVLTRAALSWLQERGIAHRLLIVTGVPDELMLDDFRDAFESGSAWDGNTRDDDATWNGEGGRAAVEAARTDVMQDDACQWIIDLTRASIDYADIAARRLGYQRAGDYIARRSHTLVAVTAHDAPAKTGGTMETVGRRAGALAARYASWPPTMPCSTALLELDTRKVRITEHFSGDSGATV